MSESSLLIAHYSSLITMPVKESSDELNPPVITTGAFISSAPRKRTLVDYVALGVATCGVGFMPLAPGTWGSLVGVLLFLLLRAASVRLFFVYGLIGERSFNNARVESLFVVALLCLIVVVTLAGIWAATRAENLFGRKDPGAVVVDEVAGQLIAFLFVPFRVGLSRWVILAGFLLFRLFDIWKPYPIRRLEVLESGLGIMADDVLAGIYAAVVLVFILGAVSLL
ncbi:MAG: phosphatidylglycerophosphatase A [Pyrinomonadaceae bacterium]